MKMSKRAFTLVEMLIVIVIIGILAAALIPRLTGIQGRARDTARETGLQNIASALELYAVDHRGFYPQHPTVSSSSGLNTDDYLATYLDEMPANSDVALLAGTNGSCAAGSDGSYAYYSTGTAGNGAKGYALTVALESQTSGNTTNCNGTISDDNAPKPTNTPASIQALKNRVKNFN